MTRASTIPDGADVDLLMAELSRTHAERRTRGCSNPVRLVGSSATVDTRTGEVVSRYSSADEPDGHAYIRCGDRRSAVCPSCSREYKGDAWHVLACGLAGGKTVPESVAEHPAVFLTLTAPSFGPVHRHARPHRNGRTAPCRVRRDRPICPHGRPLSCPRRHSDGDAQVGQPLCWQCYDYTGHVLWQWHAPELWRRLTIALHRRLADLAGIPVKTLRQVARVAYAKVTEFQARGVIHVHAVIRLDDADGPAKRPALPVTVDDLDRAVRQAVARVCLDVPGPHGQHVRLRWGRQLDIRPITPTASRDGRDGPAHAHQVAAYLAKYVTKGIEDFGLPAKGRIRHHEHARAAGACPHAVRIIRAAEQLAGICEAYRPMRARLATLAYRGHPITKSRAYSTTFTALRNARQTWRRRHARLAVDADIRDVLDLESDSTDDADALVVLGEWAYAGRGYLDVAAAAEAVRAATLARTRQP